MTPTTTTPFAQATSRGDLSLQDFLVRTGGIPRDEAAEVVKGRRRKWFESLDSDDSPF